MNCENYKKCCNFKEKKSIIYVPECIHFTIALSNSSIGACSMGLVFNDNRQELFFQFLKEVFRVHDSPLMDIKTQAKLIPYKMKDIGIGEWGFASDFKDGNFHTKSTYCLNIGKNMVFISNDKFILPMTYNYNYWWKVVEQK